MESDAEKRSSWRSGQNNLLALLFCSDGITDLSTILHQHLVANQAGLHFLHAYWPGQKAKVGVTRCVQMCVTVASVKQHAASCVISIVDWSSLYEPQNNISLRAVFGVPGAHSVHTRTESARRGRRGGDHCISWLHSPLEDTIVHQPYINQLLFLTINLFINLTPLRLCGHAQSFSGGLDGRICK